MGLPRWMMSCGAALALAAAQANAQPGPDGYDWVPIGDSGNAAYIGPDPFNLVTGRGSVGYQYSLARTELTTAQAVEFFNAALARPDPLPFIDTRWWSAPVIWGAVRDTAYTGPGVRYMVPTGNEMRAVAGLSWRQAAVICNWLHNDKASTQSAFMNGAYDVTTFTPDLAHPTFNDQAAHHPGARYWIPTLDEWMKGAHWDPNGNGPGQGRWWQQPNGTDTPLIYGPPPGFGGDGTAQANAGMSLPNNLHYQIPLGAYPAVQSPWGLLDVAGATGEWLEEIEVDSLNGQMFRAYEGSVWGGLTGPGPDLVWAANTERVFVHTTFQGVRLASSIPGPPSVLVLSLIGAMCVRRSRYSQGVDDEKLDECLRADSRMRVLHRETVVGCG